jgi:hypothetical protein
LKVKILQVFSQFPNFFIGFGIKIFPNVNLYSTHRAYKDSQEIDLKVLKTSKILMFTPKTFEGHSHRPLALLIHPSTQQSSAKQIRAYYKTVFVLIF